MSEADAASAAVAFLSPSLLVCIGALATLVAVGAGYLWQSGVFRHIEVETKAGPYGEMTVAYKTGKGPYKDTAKVHAEISALFGNANDETTNQEEDSSLPPHVGIYYDDPESVPEEELRYAVGAVLAVTDSGLDIDILRLETLIEAGYKLAVLPKQQFAVVSSFPLRTALSLYVAIFRVYPRLRKYIADTGLCAYPAIEICDGATMHFMMPLSRQEEFFVTEFSEEQVSIATTEMSTTVPDHSNLLDEELGRTSSRNSDRINRSEEKPSSSGGGGDTDVFVKPTKPAPKKAKKAAAGKVSTAAARLKETEETIAEEDEMDSPDTSRSSFEDLIGESMSDESEDDVRNCP